MLTQFIPPNDVRWIDLLLKPTTIFTTSRNIFLLLRDRKGVSPVLTTQRLTDALCLCQ